MQAEQIIESWYQRWYEAPVGARSLTEDVGPSLLPVQRQQAAPPSAGPTLSLSLSRLPISKCHLQVKRVVDDGNESPPSGSSSRHGTDESR